MTETKLSEQDLPSVIHDLMAFEQFWGYDTKQEMFQGSVEDQILQNLKYLNAIHSNNSNNSK